VVGSSRTAIANGADNAFLWIDGIMTDLGTLPGVIGSVAHDISNSGEIVGSTQGGVGGSGLNHAIIWRDGIAIDLNTLLVSIDAGWTLEAATGINESGQIAAFGRRIQGGIPEVHAFLLTPVPEPVTVTIDIKPGSDPNSINPAGKQKISVAILGTGTFDATQVNWETVLFGPGGATESHGRAHVEDVDGDGDMDLLLHFNAGETGIACGDTELEVTGEKISGIPVEASDSIVTDDCDAGGCHP